MNAATNKKVIKDAIKKLGLEIERSRELIEWLKERRKEFNGFEKLETCVTKTWDHQNTLEECQNCAQKTLERFQNSKEKMDFVKVFYAPESQRSYDDLKRWNQVVSKHWQKFKDDWKEDKKFLAKVIKSKKPWFEGELTFFK